MHSQVFHGLLPKPTHDELARQEFVKSLKLHLTSRVAPGNRVIYENRVKAGFVAKHGEPPADGRVVGALMHKEPYYRLWCALERTGQEMMWDTIIDTVERQVDEINARACPPASPLGSLSLDPGLEIPRYVAAVDIHCQPGGYCYQAGPEDATAGALFDRHGDIYGMGSWGPYCDSKGRRMISYLKRHHPTLAPKRIVEIGCSIGHSLLAYVDAFPEAEVHGIDVAAPLLRYGHARAEHLGKPVHFSQQNAEETRFADGSFDLIVSHVMLHETSTKAVRRIMRECRRLLAPNGVVAHSELQMYRDMEPFDAFMLDWDTFNNNEPFWSGLRALDPAQLLVDAGFRRESIVEEVVSRQSPWSPVYQGTNGRAGELIFSAVR